KTYQGFAAAWPKMEGTGEYGERMNSFPKYVVSTSLTNPDWANSTLIKANVPEEIAKLKQQPGKDLLVFASGNLARTLMKHNLVDEFRLMVHPVVLGSGQRLFPDGINKLVMKLVNSTTYSTGIVLLTYQTA